MKACILIPTYNNERTLLRVIEQVKQSEPDFPIVVINDGSTDSTSALLETVSHQVTVLQNEVNKGKGYSLRKGFKYAIENGFSHVITLDSDGQHFASDIRVLLEKLMEHPEAVIMGSRNMEQSGVPSKSSFGNKFSNFWFKVETGISLPDTQTGFRIYPLAGVKKLWLLTNRFELEIEVIVKLAWRFVPFYAVPIQVKYDPAERVSHFRPFQDFTRISILNTFLVLISLVWYYPRKLFRLNLWQIIKHETIKPEESNLRKSISLAFGVFMGIVPLWGFQLLIGIPLAILFNLNKVLFIAAANISIPPMIPFILAGSFMFGQWFFTGKIDFEKLSELNLASIQDNLYHYVVGAFLFATLSGIAVFSLSFGLFSLFRRSTKA
jgi:glycosyltransferase involved in cell wall biosynthesis